MASQHFQARPVCRADTVIQYSKVPANEKRTNILLQVDRTGTPNRGGKMYTPSGDYPRLSLILAGEIVAITIFWSTARYVFELPLGYAIAGIIAIAIAGVVSTSILPVVCRTSFSILLFINFSIVSIAAAWAAGILLILAGKAAYFLIALAFVATACSAAAANEAGLKFGKAMAMLAWASAIVFGSFRLMALGDVSSGLAIAVMGSMSTLLLGSVLQRVEENKLCSIS
jgi:hypothetical protein